MYYFWKDHQVTNDWSTTNISKRQEETKTHTITKHHKEYHNDQY